MNFDRHAVRDAVSAGIRASGTLEDWYYHAGILRKVLEVQSPHPAEIPDSPAVVLGEWRTVGEAWMHICLARQFQKKLPQSVPGLIAWFRAAQNGDGGFGFFPGTTSFVENCHASLRALVFLEAEPPDPTRAFRFLAGCQTISGGFGRSSRAAPFLDSTWHAVAGLALLIEKNTF